MYNENKWVSNEIKTIGIRDERLVKRLGNIISELSANPECSMPQAFTKSKDTKALYRFLDNENIKADEILKAHKVSTIERIRSRETVLLLQDTTSFNYQNAEHIKGMGLAGTHDNAKGLIMHSSLAVSTEGTPLGVLSEKIWTRDPKKKGKISNRKGRNNAHKYTMEEKESYKWIDAFNNSIDGMDMNNVRTVTVCDREADIFKLFHVIMQKGQDFVIRVGSQKRRVAEDMKLITNEIESKPVMGQVEVEIPRNTRDSCPKRTATLSIKYCPVTLLAPLFKKEFKDIPELKLNVILAEEEGTSDKTNPIRWFLLTSLPITSVEDAFEKVRWYKQRWLIERYHFILKSGCGIEELQLEDVEHIKRAIAIYSMVAWRIGFLAYGSRHNPDTSCEKVLSAEEWQALYCVVNETHKIPQKPPNIKEAVLMIAKLGGFMARKHDGEPGVKVIWRGLRKLNSIVIGWRTASLVNNTKLMGKE